MVDEIVKKAVCENKKINIFVHNSSDTGCIYCAEALEKYFLGEGVNAKCVFFEEYECSKKDDGYVRNNSISILMDNFKVECFEDYLLQLSNRNDIYVMDSNCQSLAEELFLINQTKITPEVANILAKGIFEDTSNLKYIKQGVFNCLAKLVYCGAKYEEALNKNSSKYYLSDEVGMAKVFLKTSTFSVGDTFGTIIVLSELELDALKRDYGIWFPHKQIFKMSNLKGCSFFCIVAEDTSGAICVEFRSSKVYGNIDVAKLARLFGGDGEHNAAHCSIPKNKLQNQSQFFATLKREVVNLYSSSVSNVKLNNFDMELKSIFEATKRLRKNVTIDILNKVEELIANGAKYNYLFESFKSYGRFMVENELISRIPRNIYTKSNPDVSISLSEKSIEMLSKKYNVTEDDILKSIYRFSNINVKSVKITMPDGKMSVIDNGGNVVFFGVVSNDNNDEYQECKKILKNC